MELDVKKKGKNTFWFVMGGVLVILMVIASFGKSKRFSIVLKLWKIPTQVTYWSCLILY